MNTQTTTCPATDFRTMLQAELHFIRKQASRLARNAYEADDLVQDTVERALRSRHLYTDENLRGWLSVMLLRVYLNHLRRERRSCAAMEPLTDTYAHRYADNLAGAFLLRQDIRHAMSLLKEPGRSFTEKSFDGYTSSEIARDANADHKRVRNTLFRNKAILRKRLHAYRYK